MSNARIKVDPSAGSLEVEGAETFVKSIYEDFKKWHRADHSKSNGSDLGDEEKLYVSRWENENTLVNQRLTWLLVCQGLLFAAYGAISTKYAELSIAGVGGLGDKALKAENLLQINSPVVVSGILFSVIVSMGIVAAILAQCALHKKYKKQTDPWGVSTLTTCAGWATAVLIPLVFLGAWLWVLSRPPLCWFPDYCQKQEVQSPWVQNSQPQNSNSSQGKTKDQTPLSVTFGEQSTFRTN